MSAAGAFGNLAKNILGKKNFKYAQAMVKTPEFRSYARTVGVWAGAGAVAGGVQGASDSRVGVMGGAFRGAVMGSLAGAGAKYGMGKYTRSMNAEMARKVVTNFGRSSFDTMGGMSSGPLSLRQHMSAKMRGAKVSAAARAGINAGSKGLGSQSFKRSAAMPSSAMAGVKIGAAFDAPALGAYANRARTPNTMKPQAGNW